VRSSLFQFVARWPLKRECMRLLQGPGHLNTAIARELALHALGEGGWDQKGTLTEDAA
jgi:hypothetical protein